MSNTTITPGSGNLGLSLNGSAAITVAAATLACAGAVPSLLGRPLPQTGAAALQGRAPVVAQTPYSITVPVGRLVLTTNVSSQVIQVPAGALGLAGAAISIPQVLTPVPGALGLSGFPPGSLSPSIQPPAGAIASQGQAPLLLGNQPQPAAAALAIAGFAPIQVLTVAPPAPGALGLLGYVPNFGTTVTPGTGALGLTPSTSAPVIGATIVPGVGAVTVNGFAPGSISVTIAPTGPGLSLQAFPPAIGLSITPAAGALGLTGAAPYYTRGITPNSTFLALATYQPTVAIGLLPTLGGSASLQGFAPTVINGLTPNPAVLQLQGGAPFLKLTMPVPAAAVALAAQQPIVSQTNQLPVPAGAAALQGYAPTIFNGSAILLVGQDMALQGAPPVVLTGGLGVAPAPGALALVGAVPAVTSPRLIQPAAGAVGLASSAPRIGRSVTPTAGAIIVAGQAPTPIVSLRITPAAGALGLAGAAPTLGSLVRTQTGALALVGAAPAVRSSAVITPAQGALAIVGIAPSGRASIVKTPGAGTLGLASNAPSIQETFFNTSVPAAAPLGLQGNRPLLLQTQSGGVFTDIRLVRAPSSDALLNAGPQPYESFFQRGSEVLTYGVDWEDWLANRWEAGMLASVGDVIRPSSSNGFQYICTAPGETGAMEPGWPPFLGSSVLDGSAQWTCEALDNSSLEASIVTQLWSADPGVTLLGNILIGEISITTVDTTNATIGMDYDVTCSITLSDGQQKNGVIRVKVR